MRFQRDRYERYRSSERNIGFPQLPKTLPQESAGFVDRVRGHLQARGFSPRTLGVTDYDMDAPLKAIRRLMLESNGLITIAFGRTHVAEGAGNFRSDLGIEERPLRDVWFTSPWAHIEPAMAYQLGFPCSSSAKPAWCRTGSSNMGFLERTCPRSISTGP